jgi:ferredoxin
MLFAKMLVDLYRAKPPVMNIVDGIIGMEGNGPGGGDPVNAGVIVMGRDGFAIDHVMPQIAGLDPEKVWTNLVYKKFLNNGNPPRVNILGEKIENVKGKKFKPVAEGSGSASFVPNFLKNFAKDLISPKQIYIKEKCTACLKCVKSCPVDAIVYNNEKKRIDCDYNKCISCFICQEICPEKAIIIKKPLLSRK